MKEIETISQSFLNDGGDGVLHIIKTGFNDRYIAISEDAYEMELGSIRIGTKEEMKKWFSVNLKI